jgi:hypothetical protein
MSPTLNRINDSFGASANVFDNTLKASSFTNDGKLSLETKLSIPSMMGTS